MALGAGETAHMTVYTSIIMPCYNAAAHLPQNVDSVLAQTRSDWELIIVDDGSTDTSWQEMQCLATTDRRIRVFHQANSGAAAYPPEECIVFLKAWNEWAEGNYIEPDLRWGRAYLEVARDEIMGKQFLGCNS